jgi:uncharacterized RDD family membrane protein YckC
LKTSSLIVHTPEGITFPLLLASPVTRSLAWGIDCGCIFVVWYVVNMALGFLGWVSPDFVGAVMTLAFFAISIGYGILLEWLWRGQTFGKRIFRLRVVDGQGMRLHFNQIVIRNLLRAVDALPLFYLVGGVACIFNARAQRLGDIAANTIVVRNPPVARPDVDQLLAGKFNSFLQHPHLVARLRQRVSPEEAYLALAALLRRDELESAARVERFEELAGYFRKILPFPVEASEGLTDEQYIRNVVGCLFRTEKQTASQAPSAL